MSTPLHERAVFLPPDPLDGYTGWRRRVAGFIWRFLGPPLQRQQEYNGAVAQAIDSTAFDLRREMAEQVSALADEIAKRWESMVAREQRYEARVSGQANAICEIRTVLSTLHLLSHSLKREMEGVLTGAAARSPFPGQGDGLQAAPPAAGTDTSAEAYKYVGFEEQFRGSAAQVRSNLAGYAREFAGATDVLDVGCGRGEFLQILADSGITARGIDLNPEMVGECRRRGLEVVEGDAISYVASLPDGSLGGLFAAQVVEHLDAAQLMRLLDLAYSKLRAGSRIVLETVNVACWSAFFDSYVRDLTHVRPIHPDTLKFLLQASGFQHVEVRFSAVYPDEQKLRPIASTAPGPNAPRVDWQLHEFSDMFNANVEKLNARLFTYLDYAAIATRA